MKIPHDKCTFVIVQQIANSIWPHIQFTIDVPSDNTNGIILVLDMQVAINQVGKLTYQFYVKTCPHSIHYPSEICPPLAAQKGYTDSRRCKATTQHISQHQSG